MSGPGGNRTPTSASGVVRVAGLITIPATARRVMLGGSR